MSVHPEIVADFECETGECALWDPAGGRLFWTDIPRGRMFRYDPDTGRSKKLYEGEPIGALILQADGSLAQFQTNGRVQLWRDGVIEVVCDGIGAEVGRRYNDGTADGEGAILVGTMPGPDRPAYLYRFARDGSYQVVLSKVGQANGVRFSPDGRTMYFTDTLAQTIRAYSYPDLAKSRIVVDLHGAEAKPDGLAMDVEGALWSAQWGGGAIVRYSPSGEELDRIDVPVPKVASLAFGGDDLRDVYITTAGGEDRGANGAGAGAVFRTRVAIPGLPPARGRLRI